MQLDPLFVKHKISSSGKISRSDIIRAVWAYIKSEELQDENDGRVINLDEALKELFDTDKKSVKMTAMTSLYSNFILN